MGQGNDPNTLSESVGHGGVNKRDDVIKVQRHLQLGADGVVGPGTRLAIRDYQRARRLDVTGRFEAGRIPDGRGEALRPTSPRLPYPEGTRQIYVDLPHQTLCAFSGPEMTHVYPVVTGSPTHPTVPGTFRIFSKEDVRRSATYDADMHYAMFFSRDGKAIHASYLPSELSILGLKPREWVPNMVAQRARHFVRRYIGVDSGLFASHGCVGLPEAYAIELFDTTPLQTEVRIGNENWKTVAQQIADEESAKRSASRGRGQSEPPVLARIEVEQRFPA